MFITDHYPKLNITLTHLDLYTTMKKSKNFYPVLEKRFSNLQDLHIYWNMNYVGPQYCSFIYNYEMIRH